MQALPDPSFVPVSQATPARHPRPTAHLLRQILPRDTRLQNEQDARQRLPIGHPLAPWIPIPTLHTRQQRLDTSPQPITDQRFRHKNRLRQQHPKTFFVRSSKKTKRLALLLELPVLVAPVLVRPVVATLEAREDPSMVSYPRSVSTRLYHLAQIDVLGLHIRSYLRRSSLI